MASFELTGLHISCSEMHWRCKNTYTNKYKCFFHLFFSQNLKCISNKIGSRTNMLSMGNELLIRDFKKTRVFLVSFLRYEFFKAFWG